MSRCAVMRPAVRRVSPSLNFSRTCAIDPVTSKPPPYGSTPLARSASSFLRRSAINSFSSSIEDESKPCEVWDETSPCFKLNVLQSLCGESVDKDRSRRRSGGEHSCWFPTRLPPDLERSHSYFST